MAFELFLAAAPVVLALNELVIVLPTLYLDQQTRPTSGTLQVVLLAGVAAGWRWLRSLPVSGAAIGASVGVALSAPVYFWVFSHGQIAQWIPIVVSVSSAVCLGRLLRVLPSVIRNRLSPQGLRRVLLHPALGAVLLGGLMASAIVTRLVGPLRASLMIAGALLGMGMLCANSNSAPGEGLGRGKLTRWLAEALFLVYSAGAFFVEPRLPLHRVLTSSHPIIAFAESERCSFAVTSGQGARHLFVDEELRISTFDQLRWAQSLVRPALARVARPKRALVLSTGEGLIERELLLDPEIEMITSVTRCRLVPDIGRHSAWMRQLNRDALNSAKVSVIEQDPAAYVLQATQQPFDLLIVDLPDPSGPLQAKYYSRLFYRELAARMHEQSVLVVQATSAQRSPRTFATIGATLRAAGLVVEPGIVPLISRGEWSLYFAAKQRLPPVQRSHFLSGTLAATTPRQFTQPWPDTLPPNDFTASASTLQDAKVLDWFERESEPSHAR